MPNPRKPPGEALDTPVTTLFTKEEAEDLTRRAKAQKISRGELLRRVVRRTFWEAGD